MRRNPMLTQVPITQGFEEPISAAHSPGTGQIVRATLISISEEGRLIVDTGEGDLWPCDYLQSSNITLDIGDQVLVLQSPNANTPATVMGRVGRYLKPQPETHVTLEATEALTLKCGESSIDLRADGKVLVRGDDVLVRAKGTKRIRAGSVSIN